jgi:hypothetical protein
MASNPLKKLAIFIIIFRKYFLNYPEILKFVSQNPQRKLQFAGKEYLLIFVKVII